MRECRLTTTDNPYDPFENFAEWYNFDESHGYCTCSYLARTAITSDALSDAENARLMEDAIDTLIFVTPIAYYGETLEDSVFYKKVYRERPEYHLLEEDDVAV